MGEICGAGLTPAGAPRGGGGGVAVAEPSENSCEVSTRHGIIHRPASNKFKQRNNIAGKTFINVRHYIMSPITEAYI